MSEDAKTVINNSIETSDNKKLRRIMLTVSYDGTNYHGWQYQPESITVEQVLNEALSELTGEAIEVSGSSRTDAGVHALGNLCLFDTYSRIPAEKFPYALNQRLPGDIRIQKGEDVADDFHPRFVETRKTYEYRILNTKFEIPLKRINTYHYYIPLDENKMNAAGKYLIGEHDFTSFCSVNAQSETRVRTITDLSVVREGDEIVIRVTGNGFLYNMVRIIAGTLIDVGRGQIEVDSLPNIIEAKDRAKSGPTAPPQGLTLIGYQFV